MRVEIFDRREKIQPVPLDVVKRHTYPQGTGLCSCPFAHGECGVWGKAPYIRVERRTLGHCRGQSRLGEHWERSDLCEGKALWGQGVSPCKFPFS